MSKPAPSTVVYLSFNLIPTFCKPALSFSILIVPLLLLSKDLNISLAAEMYYVVQSGAANRTKELQCTSLRTSPLGKVLNLFTTVIYNYLSGTS